MRQVAMFKVLCVYSNIIQPTIFQVWEHKAFFDQSNMKKEKKKQNKTS